METEAKKQALLRILQSYAPDGVAPERVAQLARDAEAHESSRDDLILILSSALVDGLRSGCWPWTNPNAIDVPKVRWEAL